MYRSASFCRGSDQQWPGSSAESADCFAGQHLIGEWSLWYLNHNQTVLLPLRPRVEALEDSQTLVDVHNPLQSCTSNGDVELEAPNLNQTPLHLLSQKASAQSHRQDARKTVKRIEKNNKEQILILKSRQKIVKPKRKLSRKRQRCTHQQTEKFQVWRSKLSWHRKFVRPVKLVPTASKASTLRVSRASTLKI